MDTKQKKRTDSGKRPAGKSSAQRRNAAVRRSSQNNNSKTRQSQTSVSPEAEQNTARPVAVQKRTEGSKVRKKSRKPSLFGKKAPVSAQERARRERAARSAERRRIREAKQSRESRTPTPVVVYTQPQPFNRNRLLVQLATVVAVVLALVLGLSVFFKVKTITVSGAETYSAWAVREASGISEGDNLMTFSRARAGAQIRASLPYVDKVRIGIKLPDTVNIYIEELDVVYSIQASDGTWWLMTSGGRIVEQTDGGTAETYTKVLGVVLESPMLNEQAVAKEEVSSETDPSNGETVPITTNNAQRLSAALQILEALESNDVVGEAASVDVTNLNDIELWYGTQYQVDLGDTGRMEEKITWMKAAVSQLSEYDTGVLDITFTTWADQVMYKSFD